MLRRVNIKTFTVLVAEMQLLQLMQKLGNVLDKFDETNGLGAGRGAPEPQLLVFGLAQKDVYDGEAASDKGGAVVEVVGEAHVQIASERLLLGADEVEEGVNDGRDVVHALVGAQAFVHDCNC